MDSVSVGEKEELIYLNNLTITRIKDANVIWLTSLGSIAGLTGLSVQIKQWISTYVALLMLPAFVFALSWQLDGIARIRTYIKIVVQPKLGGSWENKWSQHPVIRGKKKLILASVTFIFAWIYILSAFMLSYVGWSYWNHSLISFIVLYSIPVIFLFISLYDLIDSFSVGSFQKYESGWHKINNENNS